MIAGARYWGLIYKATNPANGKVYIGQTVEYLSERKSKHRNEAERGKDTYFCRAIREHGINGFGWEIVCRITTWNQQTLKKCLDAVERSEIAEHCSTDRDCGYNLTIGGGGSLGFKMSDESKEKMRKAKLGVARSPEARKAVGDGHRGLHHGEETRRKLRECHIGAKNPMFGKAFSAEHRQRLSASLKGRTISPEARQHYVDGAKRMWAPGGKRYDNRRAVLG